MKMRPDRGAAPEHERTTLRLGCAWFSLTERNTASMRKFDNPPPKYRYTCTVVGRPFPRRVGGGCTPIRTEAFSTFAPQRSAWGVRLFGALPRPGGGALL